MCRQSFLTPTITIPTLHCPPTTKSYYPQEKESTPLGCLFEYQKLYCRSAAFPSILVSSNELHRPGPVTSNSVWNFRIALITSLLVALSACLSPALSTSSPPVATGKPRIVSVILPPWQCTTRKSQIAPTTDSCHAIVLAFLFFRTAIPRVSLALSRGGQRGGGFWRGVR